ncbi:hypothetical protein [Metabacillus bambusae]|uniref:hypothetical protein n=1 Tax=Metabacillus bambusae TaxID=2795218 RepID=UPI001A9FEF05|nr:hypothetical protein [Metabacillus bambusae]
MKAECILKGTIIQPEQLESTMHKELMRRMVELKRTGKYVDLITLTTLPDLHSFGGCLTSRSRNRMRILRNSKK